MAHPSYAPETDTGGGGVRNAFRAAFEAAVESGGERTGATDDDDDGDDGDDDGDQDADVDLDDDDDDEPAPAAAPAKADAKAAKSTTPAKDEQGLLTDEEFTALQEKHKDDPAALRRSLEGAFTKKTQRLSEERRSYERLKPYAEMIDSFEKDPAGTLRAIAKANKIDVRSLADADETATKADATDAVDDVIAEFKTALGPELDYLGDALAPALTKLVERLAAKTVNTSVEPMKKQTQALLDKAANEKTDAIMESFEKQYPDWKEHEADMMKFAAKLNPKGMTEVEYMEALYQLATRETTIKKLTADFEERVEREVTGRFKKRNAKADAAERGESPRGAVPEGQVRKRPGGNVSFRQAAQAAMRGERFDDEDDDE